MKNLILFMITMLSSLLHVGGDIRPVESSVEPVVRASSGDALSVVSILLLVSFTLIVGLFFVQKEKRLG
jgi:hypothetical protein